MARQSFLPLVVTVGVLWVAMVVGCASKAPSPPPSATLPHATIVAVEGTSTVYRTRDWNGQSVTVRIPSQSVADIKDKNADGSVRATVTAIDPTTNQVRVRTTEGQTIVLAMAPSVRKDVQVGAPLLFTVPGPPQ